MMAPYRASLSKSQNRVGWAVLFRHPALVDPRSGRPGRRVRYGLGTRDEGEAQRIVDDINLLLSDERWWTPLARSAAEARHAPRAVEIFFNDLDAVPRDGRVQREELLALPGEGWKKVLLLGTTGAGKTTLVRQLIGTDPDEERFPTTATGRTTIADTEVVLRAGAYAAAVTFFPMDEVRDYVVDCLLRAALAALRGEDRGEVQRAVLQHPDQRFRFNYVLGDGSSVGESAPASEDLLDTAAFGSRQAGGSRMPELGELERDAAPEVITKVVDRVTELGRDHGARLKRELDPNGIEDRRVLDELIEQGMEEALRDDDSMHELVDELLDEMAARFGLVDAGHLARSSQGWGETWSFETTDRKVFIRQLRRFTSNSKLGFGRLLTPLVSGVRVAGPFAPSWAQDSLPELILFDTEGMGHTPDSSASMPTRLTRLIDEADAVVLVDNAEQPMQAAPSAVLRGLARSGHAAKLFLAFTHFDGVTGDNLPTDRDKAVHILQSCEGVLRRIGEEFGPFAEKPLRARVRRGTYFLADLQRRYVSGDEATVVSQLARLLEDLLGSGGRPTLAETRPVYDKANLVVAIRDAAEAFTEHWAAVLGLAASTDVEKAHWARVKALSRRLALRTADEYMQLRPVADLQADLQDELVNLVQNPRGWSAGEPSEDEKQAIFEDLVARLNRALLDLCHRRVAEERLGSWREAYAKSGRGSTFDRARLIASDVYAQAAPVPRAVPSASATSFLREVMEMVSDAASELNITLT